MTAGTSSSSGPAGLACLHRPGLVRARRSTTPIPRRWICWRRSWDRVGASRLTRSLRERLGLVNTISTGYAALEGAGLVTLTAQLDPANLAQAEAEIWREIRRVRDSGVTAAELERAQTTEEARREFQTETAEGRAFALGHAVTVWRLEEEAAYLHRLRAVTPEQVRAVARRYLDLEQFARVVFRPQERQ